MAMGSPGGRGGRKAISDINVTPLVDVMLVLLIIFMVATPIMTQDDDSERVLDMQLPVTTNAPPTSFNPDERLILEIDARLRVFIGEEMLTDCSAALADPGPQTYESCFDDVEAALSLNPRLNADENLYLLADTNIPYGFVVGTMNRIRQAGVTNIGMVTNPEYLTEEQRGMLDSPN